VTKLLTHVKHNVVAYLALFVALGGTSYAAVNLPAGSVGSKQLRNGAVTNAKLARGSVGARKLDPSLFAGYVRAYVQLTGTGQIRASRPASKVIAVGAAGPVPEITLRWSRPIPGSCFAEATTNDLGDVSYASASLAGGAKGDALTYVSLSGADHLVNIAIICPQS
jgi:hypothetical protein